MKNLKLVNAINEYLAENDIENFIPIMYKEVNKKHHFLIDAIYYNSVLITEYINGIEISEQTINLSDLSKKILTQINEQIV